jgi:large subunit ribosomal protein L24
MNWQARVALQNKKKPKKPKFHVRRGDTVKVITGDDKGKEGKILEVITDRARVVVEGVAMVKKHVRRSQEHPEGGIIERESSIHISNVKLIERPGFEGAKRTKKD